ncbi:zinc finger protein 184-like [Thrips palmi]|uniref:Zinc finger protein 184-like n=1 Tax=Thrips palmi TaxID=161013 RepID=A0A6P8YU64_THRPL|nr:zinc finger protein 184-like [Thrips palmi]
MKSVHANPPEKICRLCLSDSGVILPIFEGEVSERFSVPLPQKILSCLAIKVCADDPLPPHICHRCLYEVDRFHEFRETCKRTNTTFNKICNNSSESVPFDVNQVLEIKQELHDESVYHDAISELLSDDEGPDTGSSRIRKRNRCLSLLESVKRVQQAQSAVAANSSHTDWIEQAKTTTPSNTTSGSSHITPQLECRFCAKPFIYENTLLEHEELHAKGVVGEEDSGEPFEHEVLGPVPSPSPTPVITSAPSSTPVAAPAPAPTVPGTLTVHASSSGPVPNLVHDATPDTTPSASSASHPTAITVSNLTPAQSTDAAPAPEPVLASEQVIQTMETHSSTQEPQHQVQQHSVLDQSQETVDHSVSHNSVETVSLTDVTAMLLEGAFEGVRPMSNQTTNLCKYCQEHFSNHDLLKRHERLYCNHKPSLLKLKQSMQQPQLQQIQHQQLQQPQPIPQHSQSTQQSIVEAQLVPETHQLVVHQPQEMQMEQVQQSQHADQQNIFSQKVVVETTAMESTRACKHCRKDFVHRGSLWRHQMFCDANPECDLNRIVAGSKKKPVAAKNFGLRNDPQQQMSQEKIHTSTSVSALRRGGIQTTSGPFKCKFCEKRFLHRGSWWRHQKMFCSVNPEIPTVKAETKVRNLQSAPNFACRYCERTFLHRGSCWHHEQTHTGIREHACRYCSKTFNEKSRLARHERMHLGIKPFSCRQCGKAFCDASNLRNHEQIHGERAAFLCAWCGKSYTRRALLLKHEQVHAGDGEVFSCSSCPRTFPDLDLLNDHHVLCHAQEKKRFHLCQTCGQTFRTQSLLAQHTQQQHPQQHPQPQQVQQLIQESLQQSHQTQEQALHTCNLCSKAFSDASSLQHHELLHNAVPRQYRCHHSACSAVFHQRSQLDSHLLLHEGEKANPMPSSDSSSSGFHPHRPQAHPHAQQLLSTHDMHHPQSLHHELHREGSYVIEEQNLTGQTISVHHLVSQLPQ